MSPPAGPPFRVTHILLDIDGTLVDYGGALRAAFAAAAASCSAAAGVPVDGDDLLRLRMALGRDEAWRARRPGELRIETMRRTLAAHGVASEQAVRSAVAEYERVRDATLHVFADVPPALDALRARGLTLIAATNGNVNLDTVGIGAYMAGLHYADRVGLAKPDVRFFTSALDRWGIAPGAALVVGDRFDNDYAPALAAGLPAVLVDRAGQVDDPAVLRVRSLAELPALVSGATPSTW